MSAAALNVFHNVLLRSEKNDSTVSIDVSNHPLPQSTSEQVLDYCLFAHHQEYRMGESNQPQHGALLQRFTTYVLITAIVVLFHSVSL